VILGIGTDIVEVNRFESWQKYSKDQLLRIFSEQELTDCKQDNNYRLESLASRFAAKEAFFKALSASLVKLNLTKSTFSFLSSCQHIKVIKPVWGVPQLEIDWQFFEDEIKNKLPKLNVELSISHEKHHAISFVIISYDLQTK